MTDAIIGSAAGYFMGKAWNREPFTLGEACLCFAVSVTAALRIAALLMGKP